MKRFVIVTYMGEVCIVEAEDIIEALKQNTSYLNDVVSITRLPNE